MLALTTLVLSPNGDFAPLGKFLHRPDFPFERALDAEFKSCPIKGATLFNVEELRREKHLRVTITSREAEPIYALGSTRIRLAGDEDIRWKRLDEIKVGERVLLPERHNGFVVPTWSSVRRIQSTDELHSIWSNTPVVAGTLLLDGGDTAGRSFICVNGIFLSKDDART